MYKYESRTKSENIGKSKVKYIEEFLSLNMYTYSLHNANKHTLFRIKIILTDVPQKQEV